MATSTVPTESATMWDSLSLNDICEMLVTDVAELHRLYLLQAEDIAEATRQGRFPDLRIVNEIKAWEHAQDEHWSWYKGLMDDSGATEGT